MLLALTAAGLTKRRFDRRTRETSRTADPCDEEMMITSAIGSYCIGGVLIFLYKNYLLAAEWLYIISGSAMTV
jgi:hypothetical protein